jgi:hypothetical protein
MKQLLTNTSISSRVDEIVYEHHVHIPEMVRDWQLLPDNPEHLIHSYALFTAVRQLGIRAHSWP